MTTATFCAIPWLHLFGDELGHLRPCCQTINARTDDNVDASAQPHFVDRYLEAGWNSPFMKSVRRDMLEGRRPPVCARCFDEEDLSIRSYRQNSNDTLAPHIDGALAGTLPDGSVPLHFIR